MPKNERKSSFDMQIVYAQSKQLQQRASGLVGAEDIMKQLKEIERAAQASVEAPEEHSGGKHLAGLLSELERQLRALEDKARKQQRKSDKELINALGDAADGLADGLKKGMSR